MGAFQFDGIDQHLDDSEGVQMEGNAQGFRVVVVRPDDDHWPSGYWMLLPNRLQASLASLASAT